jgi:hypothetical protein
VTWNDTISWPGRDSAKEEETKPSRCGMTRAGGATMKEGGVETTLYDITYSSSRPLNREEGKVLVVGTQYGPHIQHSDVR